MARALFTWVIWSAVLVATVRADAPLRCVVCRSLITGQFYWWQSPTLSAKQPVCEPCSKLPTTCAVCKIPIRQHGRQLDDGRWLCDKDFAAGIFAQTDALRVYEDTWRELQGILAGTGSLPRNNVIVSLVDGRELKKLNATMPSDHADGYILGLTRTRTYANRESQHRIYLISGLGPARLAAVCAHEYTHTWLHENIPSSRNLDHDTIEGFCELVAYKLMAQRHEEVEKSVILANAYTRGQVNAFVQAEGEHHFHRVVNWVKTGIDEVLAQTDTGRVLALRREDPTPLPWPPPPPVPTAVPETLTLRGVSGNRARRFVLINDCTLTVNEEGRVRVGSSNLLVRCVAIRDHSVIIRVHDSPDIQELFLGGAPAVAARQ